MIISSEKSCYSGYSDSPENIYIISDTALAEKRKNWHELSGMADGYAYVKHADWAQLFDHAITQSSRLNYALIHVRTDTGKLAHVGSINKYNGKIELRG